MYPALLLLLLTLLIVLGIWLYPLWVKRRRDRHKHRSLSPLQQSILSNYLPFYDRLSLDERRRLQGHLQVLLAEKQFIGCAGLQVTEEMRVGILAIASLLLLSERGDYFPRLRSILIYPTAYMTIETEAVEGFLVEEKRIARLGESWVQDQVVLSWEQVQSDRQCWQDGENLVLHEFAHQLDQADGKGDGVPLLSQRTDYAAWATVMSREYQQLCDQLRTHQKTLLNPYGATNPAEFFAVATETFFEKAELLRSRCPQLYKLLQNYYRVNPVDWKL